jgi:methionyl aminopeptidase
VIIIKNQTEIKGIRKSSKLATQVLEYLSAYIKPGISTGAINDIAHKYITDHGAIPAPLGYEGYPKSVCISVNNVVCHGIPSNKEVLREGDIVNIDVTTILDGYYGDTSATYPVGKITESARRLIDTTKEAMYLSIQSLKPGKILNDCVGRIIQPYAESKGYSVVRELGGHGVGIKFHEDPFVFHFNVKRPQIILKPGMIFTIEPMINGSKDPRVTLDTKDGWTVRTYDNSLSAQFEHTVLITPTGYEILTKV